ncbi:MAG: hypothetical protein ACTSR8_12465 [Promethearchaeota archaeon]
MEDFQNIDSNSSLLKKFYKPDYSNLLHKIKGIKAPVKNDILQILLDGAWHSETEIIRIAKKQEKYMGTVTLGMMVHSLNNNIRNNYVEKRNIGGEMYYKISDNYVGLSRAAYSKYRFELD